MFRHAEDASLKVSSRSNPPEGLQLLVKLVSTFFGCKKLLLTPLNQSMLQHLHTCSPEPMNLREYQQEGCYSMHLRPLSHVKMENPVLNWMFYLLFSHHTNVIELYLGRFLCLLHLMSRGSMMLIIITSYILNLHVSRSTGYSWTLKSVTDTCWPEDSIYWSSGLCSWGTGVQALTAAFFKGLAFSAFLLAASNSTSLQVLLKSISCVGNNKYVTHRNISRRIKCFTLGFGLDLK